MADVPAMAAVTVALWALLAALERGGAARVAAAALALAAALLAKYSTWVLLGAAVGVVLLLEALRGAAGGGRAGRRRRRRRARSPRRSSRSRSRSWSRGQLALLSGFQWEGLRRWVESYPSTFLFQAHPLLAAAALGRPLAGVAGARPAGARRRPRCRWCSSRSASGAPAICCPPSR